MQVSKVWTKRLSGLRLVSERVFQSEHAAGVSVLAHAAVLALVDVNGSGGRSGCYKSGAAVALERYCCAGSSVGISHRTRERSQGFLEAHTRLCVQGTTEAMVPGARMLLAVLLALLASSLTNATETILFLNGDDSVISAPLPQAVHGNGIYSMSMWAWPESTRPTEHALFSYSGDKDSSFIVRPRGCASVVLWWPVALSATAKAAAARTHGEADACLRPTRFSF